MQENMLDGNAKITDNNTRIRDNSSKVIFKEPILCAQFLRDYVPLPILENVQPEDIEDVTERYIPLLTTDRESDTVKKIHLKNEKTIFLISLIEHKTKVDYNVIMKLLRYMCYIWEDYEKEMLRESEMQKVEQKALKESGIQGNDTSTENAEKIFKALTRALNIRPFCQLFISRERECGQLPQI